MDECRETGSVVVLTRLYEYGVGAKCAGTALATAGSQSRRDCDLPSAESIGKAAAFFKEL